MSAPSHPPVPETEEEKAQRLIPQNIDAEQALLGAILYENTTLELIEDDLRPEHFYEPFHARLYDAIRRRIRKGALADPLTLVDQLKADPAFETLGGLRYLLDLYDHAPPAAHAGDFARQIHELATRREVIRFCRDGIEAAGNAGGETTAADVIIQIERDAAAAVNDSAGAEKWVRASDMVLEAVRKARERKGAIDYPSGLADLDKKLCGLHAGEMTIIGARPGVGKSVAAQAFAKANAARGTGVLFFSLEMDADPMGIRLACDLAYNRRAFSFWGATSNPTSDKASQDKLEPAQWAEMAEAGDIIADWPLLFDTRPGLTVGQIEAASRRAIRKWKKQGIERFLVIVDHLGKVRPERERAGSKHAEVADVSNDLAAMAKRLGVALLALCQLNRGVENRDDKRPQLSDLRQAGEIEEDARQVIFLYRPEHYLRDGGDDESPSAAVERETKLQAARNKMFWIIEKNSHGPRGQVMTFCEIGCSALRDWEP